MIDLSSLTGFQWDSGNSEKNWTLHQVTNGESEEVFFNEPILVRSDGPHSSKAEGRYYVLGQTNVVRHLFVVFTVRKNLIRVISARDMNQNEDRIYEKLKKDSPL
ncbi:MAG: BrnT family toxin [Leptospirales bacterium]|nr:BrnT family toxin [Leptospirales bacterium]